MKDLDIMIQWIKYQMKIIRTTTDSFDAGMQEAFQQCLDYLYEIKYKRK